jgi:hypothetical protein
MKLEYLPDRPTGFALIRLYDYTWPQVHTLRQIANELSSGSRKIIVLQNEDWIEPVNGCKLALRRHERDNGIRQVAPASFECELTGEAWNNVAVKAGCSVRFS